VFSNTVCGGDGQAASTTRASGAPEGESYSTAEFAAVQDCGSFTARYSRRCSKNQQRECSNKNAAVVGSLYKD
jgi:hypothetical protein